MANKDLEQVRALLKALDRLKAAAKEYSGKLLMVGVNRELHKYEYELKEAALNYTAIRAITSDRNIRLVEEMG